MTRLGTLRPRIRQAPLLNRDAVANRWGASVRVLRGVELAVSHSWIVYTATATPREAAMPIGAAYSLPASPSRFIVGSVAITTRWARARLNPQ